LGKRSVRLTSKRDANRAVRHNVASANCDGVDIKVRQRVAFVREIPTIVGNQTRGFAVNSYSLRNPATSSEDNGPNGGDGMESSPD
jgi:hypothetical protein